MADDPEEKQTTSKDFSSTKAAIFETFNKLKIWREQQVEQFRKMQLMESQKLIQLSDASQRHSEKAFENAANTPESGDVHQKDFMQGGSFSSVTGNNAFAGYDTLQDSSLTGHLQRCFDDSSQCSLSGSGNTIGYGDQNPPVFNGVKGSAVGEINFIERKNAMAKDADQNCSSGRQAFPFLKKGTGLMRYMPKSATNRSAARRVRSKVLTNLTSSPKRNTHRAQRALKLKPAIREVDVPIEHVKHIRFDIPSDVLEENGDIGEPTSFKSAMNGGENKDSSRVKFKPLSSSSCPENCGPNDKLEEISSPEIESLNLSKENKELEEFEMLENYAQNCSFSSDSSIVQRVLNRKSAKVVDTNQKKSAISSYDNMNGVSSKVHNEIPTENSIFSAKLGLSKCLEEVHTRKQMLQKVISDINPRIQSLQKEISNCNNQEQHLDDSDVSERCSTPIEDLSLEDRYLSTIPEDESSIMIPDPPAPSVEKKDEICSSDCKSCNIDDVLKDMYPDQNDVEGQNSICESIDFSTENNQLMNDRLKIREKLQELENEIAIYQDHNKKWSAKCKERDEIIRKYQKECEDFNKYKDAEKKKLEDEMQEARKQIRRQKETFTRYQKLRKDNPTRKERDELNALRQEVEKLQEEAKRQKIKYTSESRRMKNQLDAAEKERDSFKLENIRIEEQVQDLLAALKTRIKNNPEAKVMHINGGEDNVKSTKETSEKKVAEERTLPKQLETDLCTKSDQVTPKSSNDKKTKPKVRFASSNGNDDKKINNPEVCVKETLENRSTETISEPEVSEKIEHVINRSAQKENDVLAANISTISVSIEAEFKEIDYGNKIERIYNSGEREIIYSSGTRKIISTDGKSKFLFFNGDSKEIFPDKREIYRYVNGVTETHFSDGLEVTEYPNGQVQRCYPDGQKEVKFPDGTMHNIYADGAEEIRSADGNVVNVCADGTETIEFANGQRQIQTATYKRREFPDGSVKIIYNSGRQETRYSDGRIRIKNKEGKVIVDTKYLSIDKD